MFFNIIPRPWCPPGWKGAVSLAKVYYITEIDIGSNSVPVLVDVLKGLYICRDLRLIIGMLPGESGDHQKSLRSPCMLYDVHLGTVE